MESIESESSLKHSLYGHPANEWTSHGAFTPLFMPIITTHASGNTTQTGKIKVRQINAKNQIKILVIFIDH
jgi:hypothetical protein